MPSLLDIPSEIRVFVYKHYFASVKITYYSPQNLLSQKKQSKSMKEVGVLAVSKLIRAEALQILYEHKVISFGPRSLMGALARSNQYPASLSHLRHVSIDYSETRKFVSIVDRFTSLKNLQLNASTQVSREVIGRTSWPQDLSCSRFSEDDVRDQICCTSLKYLGKSDVFPKVIAHWRATGGTFGFRFDVAYVVYFAGTALSRLCFNFTMEVSMFTPEHRRLEDVLVDIQIKRPIILCRISVTGGPVTGNRSRWPKEYAESFSCKAMLGDILSNQSTE